jgi:hypothetical protein
MATKSLISKIVATASAVAILGTALPAVTTPVEAKPIKIIKVSKHVHHYRHFYGTGLVIAGVAAASSSCYWLKVRALRTGDDYWWDRYHACIGD